MPNIMIIVAKFKHLHVFYQLLQFFGDSFLRYCLKTMQRAPCPKWSISTIKEVASSSLLKQMSYLLESIVLFQFADRKSVV